MRGGWQCVTHGCLAVYLQDQQPARCKECGNGDTEGHPAEWKGVQIHEPDPWVTQLPLRLTPWEPPKTAWLALSRTIDDLMDLDEGGMDWEARRRLHECVSKVTRARDEYAAREGLRGSVG